MGVREPALRSTARSGRTVLTAAATLVVLAIVEIAAIEGEAG